MLTPIFWRPPLEDDSFAAIDRANLARRDEVMRHAVFGVVDALTPPSQAELDGILARYPASPLTRTVVPVGVDPAYRTGDGQRFCVRYGLPLRGFVLCVGRIEERKNQLRLIEACATLDVPVVLIGAVYDDRQEYDTDCRALAERLGADVRFLSFLTTEEVVDAYAAARVHVLPSLWETIGLSSLEAAAAGCGVVSTSNCGVREYLGDDAWYCDPESVESIRAAVEAAVVAPVTDALGSRVTADFGWARAAETLVPVYEAVMRRAGDRSGIEPEWRASLTPEQYIDHLESLIQLQLETIALRDGHDAAVRESAETAIEYAQSLEGRARTAPRAGARDVRIKPVAIQAPAVTDEPDPMSGEPTPVRSLLQTLGTALVSSESRSRVAEQFGEVRRADERGIGLQLGRWHERGRRPHAPRTRGRAPSWTPRPARRSGTGSAPRAYARSGRDGC